MNARKLSLFVVSFLLCACGSVVSEGGGAGGNPGAGGSGATGSSSSGSPTVEQYPAIALTRAQMDAFWASQGSSGSGSGTGGGGGGSLDSNDLFLRLSDLGLTCPEPYITLPCGGHYQLSIVLPPALQAVGVYNLEAPELLAYSMMSETGSLDPMSPDDCPFGGGSIGPGSIEILSIDAAQVQFKVSMSSGLWSEDPSGVYTAPRCP